VTIDGDPIRLTTCCTRRVPTCFAGSAARSRHPGSYREALALTTSDAERRFLARRLAEVTN
jgi:hypothetical protein